MKKSIITSILLATTVAASFALSATIDQVGPGSVCTKSRSTIQLVLHVTIDPTTNQPYYNGPIDGCYDADMTAAVKEYQKDKGLSSTGSIGRLTRVSLINDLKKFQTASGVQPTGSVGNLTYAAADKAIDNPITLPPIDVNAIAASNNAAASIKPYGLNLNADGVSVADGGVLVAKTNGPSDVGSAKLKWGSGGASFCRISVLNGGAITSSASPDTSPIATGLRDGQTGTMTCTNAAGDKSTTLSFRVSLVQGAYVAPLAVTASVNGQSVVTGSNVTVQNSQNLSVAVTSNGATNCYFYKDGYDYPLEEKKVSLGSQTLTSANTAVLSNISGKTNFVYHCNNTSATMAGTAQLQNKNIQFSITVDPAYTAASVPATPVLKFSGSNSSSRTVGSGESISLDWAVTGAASYKLKTDAPGYAADTEYSLPNGSWTGTMANLNVTSGTSVFSVSACNANNVCSPYSNTVSVTVVVTGATAPTSITTDLVISPQTVGLNDAFAISMQPSEVPTSSFYYEYKLNNGNFMRVPSSYQTASGVYMGGSNVNTPAGLGLSAGQSYTISARTCNASGCGSVSTKSITVTAPAQASTPSSLTLTVTPSVAQDKPFTISMAIAQSETSLSSSYYYKYSLNGVWSAQIPLQYVSTFGVNFVGSSPTAYGLAPGQYTIIGKVCNGSESKCTTSGTKTMVVTQTQTSAQKIAPTFSLSNSQAGTRTYAPGESITVTWNANSGTGCVWASTLPNGSVTNASLAASPFTFTVPTAVGSYSIAISCIQADSSPLGSAGITITVATPSATSGTASSQVTCDTRNDLCMINGVLTVGTNLVPKAGGYTWDCTSGSVTVKCATPGVPVAYSSRLAPAVLGDYTACVDLPTNFHRGSESSQVKSLQAFLTQKGYFVDDISGFYGDKTVDAVKDYQLSKDLPATGMVYDFTRIAIKNDTCR